MTPREQIERERQVGEEMDLKVADYWVSRAEAAERVIAAKDAEIERLKCDGDTVKIAELQQERDTLRERVRDANAFISSLPTVQPCANCFGTRQRDYRDRIDKYMSRLTEEWDLPPKQMMERVLSAIAEVDAHCAKREEK